MIYCIWYPSGGFGHFVNAVISLYGDGFARPQQQDINFSDNGNSHAMDVVLQKYRYPDHYTMPDNLLPNLNYTVLVDNGIDNESVDFVSSFPNSSVLKICYSDQTWPIVAHTMIDKAMNTSLDTELLNNVSNEPWAKREKYFLYLRDHYFRSAWKPQAGTHTILIDDILNYTQLCNCLTQCKIQIHNFESTWDQWRSSNQRYITPVEQAQAVIDAVVKNQNHQLKHITDIWQQAVIYYYLWLTFGYEVPHNDYCDFFNDTASINQWLESTK